MKREEIVGSTKKAWERLGVLSKLESKSNASAKEIKKLENNKYLLWGIIDDYKKLRRWNILVNIGFIICAIAFIACIVLTFTYDDKQYVIESYQETAVVAAVVAIFKIIVVIKIKKLGIGRERTVDDVNEEIKTLEMKIQEKETDANNYQRELQEFKDDIKYTGREWDFLTDIEGNPNNVKRIEVDIIRMMLYSAFDPADDIDKVDSWINRYYDVTLAYSLTDNYEAKAKCERCSEIMKNSNSWILNAFNAFMSTRGIASGQSLMKALGKQVDSFTLKDAFEKCELGVAQTDLDNEFLDVCIVFATRHCESMVIGDISGYFKK